VQVPVADAILDFFLEAFSFSPAKTTAELSFLHKGQYLQQHIINPIDYTIEW